MQLYLHVHKFYTDTLADTSIPSQEHIILAVLVGSWEITPCPLGKTLYEPSKKQNHLQIHVGACT